MARFAILLAILLPPAEYPAAPFDLIIANGRIVDGTGSPWYAGDVAIRNGRIAAIGRLSGARAAKWIDAHGLIVAPGFIDMLGQSELSILVEPRVPSKIFQGITTEVTGEGRSVAPLDDAILKADRAAYEELHIVPDWRDFSGYFARLEKQGIGINVASYVGATQVRRIVLGDDDRTPTPAELARMKSLVRDAMRQGAVGVSTALEYAPAPYAKSDELIALAAESAAFGGIYATHIRSEGDTILSALDEAIRIGREARIPVEIWHLKAAGKENWGRMPEIVSKIEAARQSGLDIAADTYAYPAWFNSLSAFVPPWAHDGGDGKLVARLKDPETRRRVRTEMESSSGDWDNEWREIPGPEAVLLCAVHEPVPRSFQGRTLLEIANLRKREPIEALLDLLTDDPRAYAAVFGISEPDILLALTRPWVSVDNDSRGTSPEGVLGSEHPHPRAYGTFPRILRKYVREEKVLRLEEAIRKFSALAAQRMGFSDRGVLKEGMWADVVVFDPERIRDLATFETPNQLSVGMEDVLINGVPVIEAAKATGALPGKILRGPGFQKP